jgi:hypothetical protein
LSKALQTLFFMDLEAITLFVNDDRWPADYELKNGEALIIARFMEKLIEEKKHDAELHLLLKKFWKKYNMDEAYHTMTRGLWSIGDDPNNPVEPFQL